MDDIKNNDYELELHSLLEEMGVAKESTPEVNKSEIIGGIPLEESEIKGFSFNDSNNEIETPIHLETDGEFPEEILKGSEELIDTRHFTEEGLSEDLRRQMLLDATLHEDSERVIDSSEFTNLISEVLGEQEEMDNYSHFEEKDSLTDVLKEQFELERQKEMLDVNNNVLSIQNENEEITEFILCEGIYSEPFKIFIHTSPLVKDGDIPLVIDVEGEYILFRRLNPEPKVIKSLLTVLPNFKFTHVSPTGESPLNLFSFIDKCTFTN